jgi:DNA repair photolyase
MIRSITAKTLLSSVRQPDPWFGLRFSMNLYRGCQHQCVYCDSRSECHQIEDFRDILVKSNAVELLRLELSRKRIKGTIGTGSMNDPYMPLEAELDLTGRALEVIAEYQFPVHVLTKSDLVTRDVDRLVQIGRVYAAASFTITSIDDSLAREVEPGAPPTSRRLRAMQALAARGVLTGTMMMPVLPFLEDDEANIIAIVEQTKDHGGAYVVAAFGMTLRDRQRAYYYDQLDRLFPGMTRRYQQAFGARYECPASDAARLEQVFRETCERVGLATRMPAYSAGTAAQLPLL